MSNVDNPRFVRPCLVVLFLLVSPVACSVNEVGTAPDQTLLVKTDADTGLTGWYLTNGNLDLELTQLLPDHTRSFFSARGLPKAIVDQIANSCVFRTAGKNSGQHPGSGPSISLEDWRVSRNGKSNPPKLKNAWQAEWKDKTISNAARTAFRWAMFPSEQTYAAVGDYGWGMISFGPAPGEHFDLTVHWKEGDKSRQVTIEGMACANDQ